MGYFKDIWKLAKKSILLTDTEGILTTFGDWFERDKKGNQTGLVSSCINTWGNYYSKANFRLYKKRSDGALIERTDHPFLNMMNEPNEFQVWWELKYFIAAFQAVNGNAYFLKLRNGLGVWIKTIMLEPQRVKPISSKTKWIDHYEYDNGDKTIDIAAEDIVHIRYPHSGSFIKGEALISGILDQIEVDKMQTAYMRKFLDKGGFLGQVWSTNQMLDKTSFNRAKAQLESKMGVGKSFDTALFEGGLQPVKSAYSIKDMDLSGQRKLSKEEILGAFRTPAILIGGASDYTNRASAEAAMFGYTSTFIDPNLDYVDSVWTKHVKMEFGNAFVVKHDSLAPKDVEGKLKYYQNGIDQGWLTRNEVREEENWEPSNAKLMDAFTDSVGGALVDLTTGKQIGQKPNNANSNTNPQGNN